MAIDRETLEQFVYVSRLELTEEEMARFPVHLSEILAVAKALHNIDTTGVEPTFLVGQNYNVFREDEPRPSMEKEKVLANAPVVQEGMFRVPRILDEE